MVRSIRSGSRAFALCLFIAVLPRAGFADDLDDVLDDLIQYQQAKRAAVAQAEAAEQKLATARADQSIAATPTERVPVNMERASERKPRSAARREYKRASLRSM